MTMPVAGAGGAVAISSLSSKGELTDNSLSTAFDMAASNYETITVVSGKLHLLGISLSDLLSIVLLCITVIVTVVTALYELAERRYRVRIRKGNAPVRYIPRPILGTTVSPTYGRVSPIGHAGVRCTKVTPCSNMSIKVIVISGGVLAIISAIIGTVITLYPNESISNTVPYLIHTFDNLLK